MPFVVYTAIKITTKTLDHIEQLVGSEEWEKSKDEMRKLATSEERMYLLPDWTPHLSCDHVTDGPTLAWGYDIARWQTDIFWITPKK